MDIEDIVSNSEPITLLGSGALDEEALQEALALAPEVVAADGAATLALARGLPLRAVIGDMDSLSAAARAGIPEGRLHRIGDQETTDFDKCLRSIRAPLVIGVGFTGKRLDHQLAAYNTLVRHPARACILLGEADLVFLAPPVLRLSLPAGMVFSLFPMGAVEGVSEGLRWPINGLNFAPDGRVGTSNEVVGDVSLTLTAPKMLTILPRSALPAVAAALQGVRATWPAHGKPRRALPRS